MNKYATSKKCLEVDERNLLSVAYKNVVGSKRSAWRVISSLEGRQKDSPLPAQYKARIETELNRVCREVLVSFMNNTVVKTIHCYCAEGPA